MPYIDVMLRGTQLRVYMDDKVGQLQPYRELVVIFNDLDMDFHKFFENNPNGDEELRGIDPNNCNVKRTDAFLKGNYASSYFDLKGN